MYIDFWPLSCWTQIYSFLENAVDPDQLAFYKAKELIYGSPVYKGLNMGQSFQDFKAVFLWKVSLKMLN